MYVNFEEKWISSPSLIIKHSHLAHLRVMWLYVPVLLISQLSNHQNAPTERYTYVHQHKVDCIKYHTCTTIVTTICTILIIDSIKARKKSM